jgi:excisionase family DNA binding protein
MPRTKAAKSIIQPHVNTASELPRLAYGVDVAAGALGLSRSRIYELIADGEITACKVGKRTIISATELITFLERHRVERLANQSAVATPQRQGGPVRKSTR